MVKRYGDSSPDGVALSRHYQEEVSTSVATPDFEEDSGDIWKTFAKADEIGEIGQDCVWLLGRVPGCFDQVDVTSDRASGVRKMGVVDQRVVAVYNRTEIEEISLRWNENIPGSNVGKNVLPEAVNEGTCFHEYNSIL